MISPFYLHSLVYKILTKVRYKKCFATCAIVCIVASLFLEQIKAWNRKGFTNLNKIIAIRRYAKM